MARGFGRAFFDLVPGLTDLLYAPTQGTYSFDTLIVPVVCTLETELHRPSFAGLRWQALSSDFVSWIDNCVVPKALERLVEQTKWEGLGDKIFISRRDTPKRSIINEDEVVNVLNNYGFTTIVPSELSFYEQVAISAQCKIMLGIHGAGLANCLFSPKGSSLIEVRSAGSNDVSFKYFAQSKGLDYSVIVAHDIEDKALSRSEWSVMVDLDSLKRHLDTLAA